MSRINEMRDNESTLADLKSFINVRNQKRNLRIYQKKFITVNSRKGKRKEKLKQNIKLPETILSVSYINRDIINCKNRNRKIKYAQGYHI